MQTTVWVATLTHVPGVQCSWTDLDGDGPDGNGWWDAILTFITSSGGEDD